MNKFKYLVCLKELEQCKTINKLEELLRMYQNNLSKIHAFIKKTIIYHEFAYNYKLYSKALYLHNKCFKRKLPDFLYNSLTKTQTKFFDLLFKFPNMNTFNNFTLENFTFENLIDLFEFDTVIYMNPNPTTIFKLDQLIKDRPIYFTLRFNTSLTSFAMYSLENLNSRHHKLLVQAIKYKKQVLKNKKHTVNKKYLEHLIKNNKISINKDVIKTIDTDIDNLKYQIKSLQTLKDLR